MPFEKKDLFELLNNTPIVSYRLATKKYGNPPVWQLYTLIVDIIPDTWLSSPSNIGGKHELKLDDYIFKPDQYILGSYAFFTSYIDGKSLASWLFQDGLHELDYVFPIPGNESKKFSFIVPEWVRNGGNVTSLNLYSWNSFSRPRLPWPSTLYQFFGSTDYDSQVKVQLGSYLSFEVAIWERICGVFNRQ